MFIGLSLQRVARNLALLILIPCLFGLLPFFTTFESDEKFVGTGIIREAFAHGMNSEFLPPVSLEGRQLNPAVSH